jgi:hypothetical protein
VGHYSTSQSRNGFYLGALPGASRAASPLPSSLRRFLKDLRATVREGAVFVGAVVGMSVAADTMGGWSRPRTSGARPAGMLEQ